MPITVPVPEEYAKKFDASTPSKYDQYVAFTGPYMVKNDPKTGKVTGRVPGKSIDIVRNPNWDKSTDYRPAYLDEIKIEEGNDDLATASRRALNGSDTVCCDAGSPPAQVLKQAAAAPEGPGALRAVGRHALHRVQHDGQAVRQHQHPQGDHRVVQPQRPAPDARRRGPRRHRQRLDPARASPASRRPAA